VTTKGLSAPEFLAYVPTIEALLARGYTVDELIEILDQAPSVPDTPPEHWADWLRAYFPTYTTHAFGRHHVELWEWAWAIRSGERPRPFVAIWPRGGAKSTSAEMAVCALGARVARRYTLYICRTQEQADDHVGNVASLLESERFGAAYPQITERMLGKYGNSRGWRRNRLRTSTGFTVDAIGLDTAARGVKLEEQRPDLIVLDDLDDPLDSPATVERNIIVLTRSLLPAGTDDVAVLGVQNLVREDGIFARLADDRADFLADRIVSGPLPALLNEAHEVIDGRTVLVAGDPVWEGQNLEACQRIVERDGISSFLIESQHEVDQFRGGTFADIEFRHCEWAEVPDLVRVAVWCDPAVTDKDSSDANGIQADGLGRDGKLYRLFSWERRASPEVTLRTAILKAVELKGDHVGIETDQGGDVWRPAYDKIWADLVASGEIPEGTRKISMRQEKAGAGFGPKAHRGQQMLPDYERGQIVHVIGTHALLERSLRRFPLRKPFDLVDACFWSHHALRRPGWMAY